MTFDIALPIAIFFIASATILLSTKLEKRVKSLLEEKEFTMRDSVLLVIAMGGMVTALVFVPSEAILVLFLWVFSVAMFMITYLISQKWYLGFIGPAVFLALYFIFKDTAVWKWYLLDVFAVIFIVFITVYVGSFFTWKTTLAFATFLTIMDIIQVLGTGYMVQTSGKIINLALPIFIVLPVLPSMNLLMALGLGDLFLTGLLGVQAAKKFGRKFAMTAVLSMAIVFGIVETLTLTYFPHQALPATVMIFGGWLIAVSFNQRDMIVGNPYLTEITAYALLAVIGVVGALAQNVWWLFPAFVFCLLGAATAIEYRYRRFKT